MFVGIDLGTTALRAVLVVRQAADIGHIIPLRIRTSIRGHG